MSTFDPNCLRLYLVTNGALSQGRSLVETVMQAVAGGVTLVQLREKEAPDEALIELARALRPPLQAKGVPLIINDRVEVAKAVAADGVHLGQQDMACAEARARLGPGKIIGLSVENRAQAQAANDMALDYIGLSPVFATRTKTDVAPPLELAGVGDIMQVSRHPAVAIGGIKPDRVDEVLAAGAHGVAVVSHIMAAAEPLRAARDLRQRVDHWYAVAG